MEDKERTLYCGNLSEKVTEDLLYELFLQAGPLENVTIPKDKDGRPRNFAFIAFKHSVSVQYAIALMNGISLYGKPLNLNSRSTTNEVNPYLKQLQDYMFNARNSYQNNQGFYQRGDQNYQGNDNRYHQNENRHQNNRYHDSRRQESRTDNRMDNPVMYPGYSPALPSYISMMPQVPLPNTYPPHGLGGYNDYRNPRSNYRR